MKYLVTEDEFLSATVNEDGELEFTRDNGEKVVTGVVKGAKGDKGDPGAPGPNTVPTQEAITQAITQPGPVKDELNATIGAATEGKQDASSLDADTAALVGSGDSALAIAVQNLIGGYQPETLALLERMDIRPDADRRAAIDTLIVSLKEWGIWETIDSLWAMAAHSPQAALLNWKADERNLIAINSPNFIADRGFAGDGSTSWVRTVESSMSGLHLTPSSSTIGVWSLTDESLASAGRDIALGNSSGGTSSHSLNSQTPSGFAWTANQAQRTIANASSMGLYTATRDESGVAAHANGAEVDSAALTAPATATFGGMYTHLGRAGSNYSSRRYAIAFWGGALDAAQHAALYNAFSDYLGAVGAH